MSVEAALKDNENRWEAALAAHDASKVQGFVANDFVGVYTDGKIMSKSAVIGQVKKDKDTYKSAVNEKLAVHSYGSNVAVVVGTAHEKGTAKDGKAFDRSFRFTDTWVERNGQWQCVASQVMKVKG
jgi:ketosteroid isomerase-like protein